MFRLPPVAKSLLLLGLLAGVLISIKLRRRKIWFWSRKKLKTYQVGRVTKPSSNTSDSSEFFMSKSRSIQFMVHNTKSNKLLLDSHCCFLLFY